MTLTKIFVICIIAGIALTLIVEFVFKKRKSWVMSFVQNFAGAFFLFSGMVKAVDPLGLAYKMEQYFAEFQDTFARLGMEGFSEIFPMLSEISTPFAVFMIVLELVVGVALIIGFSRFVTAFTFFGLIVFFAILTGFTHLTGYVPGQDYVMVENSGVKKEVLESEATKLVKEGWIAKDTTQMNFFKFSKWVPFDEANQKVTDCGCFGDYLVLKPKTSFYKDLILFIPAFLMLFGFKKMHQIFKPGVRWGLILASLVGFTIYNVSNYKWDIPANDFRPFKNGVDIAKTKAAETEAAENAPVTYKLTNKGSGEQISLAMNDYISKYKNYPKAEWDIKQQRGEPAVPTTKISDFECSDINGNDVTEDILSNPDYSFMVISYKLKNTMSSRTETYNDTTYIQDTMKVSKDSIRIEPRLVSIDPKVKEVDVYNWNSDLVGDYKNIINPLAEKGKSENVNTFVITAYASGEKLNSFKAAIGADYPFYTADDILLKTIVRSNPGVLLMKNGKIIHKWHKSKVPSFEEIKRNYIR